jgi:hypothetical protein
VALLPDSPAVDAGSSGGLRTDQRGKSRPIDNPAIVNEAGGDGSDIGAFELQSQPITLLDPMNRGSDIVVSFLAEVGQKYRVERKDALIAGPWATVTDNIIGTGGVVQVIDPGAAELPQRFYRGQTIP